MFVCRGCIRSLAASAVSATGPRMLSSLRTTTGTVSSLRTYSVDAASLRAALETAVAEERAKFSVPPQKKEKDSNDEEELEYDQVDPRADQAAKEKYQKQLEAGLKKHLSMMPDPYHIAQYISSALQKDKFDEALMMTRMASRNKKVEVSWNHLIDYLLKKHRLNAAIKLYNEMKKRAQVPNARTYTIIFRGCAISPHPKLAVSHATRIYNFMLKYGALKPNTIHMNAVLEVCARAGDLESLFTILATANTAHRSPDSYTYTIVLNALRYEVERVQANNLGLADEEVQREIQTNVQRGRALWTDVMTNWRNARLVLDEHLVVAMGRLLSMGNYNDNQGVFELLEQTMEIPRLDLNTVHLPHIPSSEPSADDEAHSSQTTSPDGDSSSGSGSGSASPMSSVPRPLGKAPIYAQPGNKTLSLVLTTLTNVRKTSKAYKYWSYLTRLRNVKPDAENYFVYLRALGAGHASERVAQLIEEMPRGLLSFITFRRAFATCVHDSLNQNAFDNACRIFDVMINTQRYADPLSMRLFLQVARGSTRHFYEDVPQSTSESIDAQSANPNPADFRASSASSAPPPLSPAMAKALRAHGRQITTALDRMWQPYRIVSSSLSYPNPAEPPTTSPEELHARQRGNMQEIMATGRRMIAAIDRVTQTKGMLETQQEHKFWMARRKVLQKAVERWILKLYKNGDRQSSSAPAATSSAADGDAEGNLSKKKRLAEDMDDLRRAEMGDQPIRDSDERKGWLSSAMGRIKFW